MSDYDSLNLNAQLISNDSLANQGTLTTGFQLDNELERDAITLPKIRNFSFSSGQGGTLTLGGTNNGNGVLYIKNAAGSTIITADNTGITINGGNITIQNSVGSTVIDANGLNSLANFESGGTTGGAGTITSLAYTDWPGLSLTTSNFTRSKNVFVFCGIHFKVDTLNASNFNDFANIRFDIDGSEPPNATNISWQAVRTSTYTDGVQMHYSMMYHYQTFGTGTHIIKIKAGLTNGNGTEAIINTNGACRLSYAVLGN